MSDFSFRWGIPSLDEQFTLIYNWMLETYASIHWTARDGTPGSGISNSEMMFILHLASHRYERTDSEARPSHRSLAERLGTDRRYVIRIQQALIDKGLLTIEKRPGFPNVYDFGGFSRACLDLKREHDFPHSDVQLPLIDDIPQGGRCGQKDTGGVVKKTQGVWSKRHMNKSRAPNKSSKTPSPDGEAGEPPDPALALVQPILQAYLKALGYVPTNVGAEAAHAKRIAYSITHTKRPIVPPTIDDLIGCYKYLKSDAYWTGRHISLAKVGQEVNAWIAAGRLSEKPAASGNYRDHKRAKGQRDKDYWDNRLAAKRAEREARKLQMFGAGPDAETKMRAWEHAETERAEAALRAADAERAEAESA